MNPFDQYFNADFLQPYFTKNQTLEV